MAKYKWGILAPGTIAKKFAQGLSVIPDAIPYAVGSRDIQRAKDFASEFKFEKSYGSYEELSNDPDIDIIYVAVPHTLHKDAALMCLKKGKAVLCEKPMGINAAQIAEMTKCARENNVFLMEAAWNRFLPVTVKLRELLKSGAIGDVRLVYADFGFRANVDPEARLFAPALGGGSLLDVGVYNLSLCSMIFGKQPAAIHSHMNIGSTAVDEECAVMLQYEQGQSAFLFSALRLNTPWIAKIIGEDGRIEIPSYWNGRSLKLYKGRDVEEFDLNYETTGYQYEAIEVMRCLDLELKESPVMPLEESLKIMQTADLIRKENNLSYPME